MLYRPKVGVCYEIHAKHINAHCGNNAEFFSVKHDGTDSTR